MWTCDWKELEVNSPIKRAVDEIKSSIDSSAVNEVGDVSTVYETEISVIGVPSRSPTCYTLHVEWPRHYTVSR